MLDENTFKIKSIILTLVLLLCSASLVFRLGWLQLANYKYYRNKAIENSSRVTFLRAPRGVIYDRHGNLLATNAESLSLVAIPSQLDDIENESILLSKILNQTQTELFNKLDSISLRNSILPVVIERDLDIETVSKIYENQLFLPGIDILSDISRVYPYSDITAHILGYCGEITESQLANNNDRKMGDVVGQEGIEKIYDDQLRGIDGEQRIKVNALGQALRDKSNIPKITKQAVPGLPIITSIDLDLQKIAYEALAGKSGACVACDPRTGEILALVSQPSFNPNIFSHKIKPNDWQKLNAPDHPLFNRALSGYPPGSIWKAITLLAALESHVVKPDTKLQVSGGISLGGFFFGDWTRSTGLFDLVKCLAWSRDSAFYQMGLKLKPEQIKYWACLFGGGRPTGVELPHESSGLIPDSAWKLRVMKEKWYPGNTLHMSIGQTFIQLTPMQAARIYCGFAGHGKLPNLHLVTQINKRVLPVPACENIKTNKEYLKVVLDGLEAVVASGTGGICRLPGIKVAGKTGSAEAPPAHSKTHAWFACYAPVENPSIVIVVFVEHGGHGGSAAAPVAKQVLEKYFHLTTASYNTKKKILKH